MTSREARRAVAAISPVVDQAAADALASRIVAQGNARGGRVTVAQVTDAITLQELTQRMASSGRCAGTLADDRRWVLAVRYSGVYDLQLGGN